MDVSEGKVLDGWDAKVGCLGLMMGQGPRGSEENFGCWNLVSQNVDQAGSDSGG